MKLKDNATGEMRSVDMKRALRSYLSEMVGQEAADLWVSIYRRALLTWLIGAACLAAWGVGESANVPLLVWAGVVLAVVWVAFTIYTWRTNVLYRRAVSRALGIPIMWKSNPPPPRRKDHYLKWCEKYNTTPYPFKHRDSKDHLIID